MRMTAKSPAAVAAAFSRSSRPMFPGDSCLAAIPEPITTAAKKALPRNSAKRRLHSADPVIRYSAARGLDGDRSLCTMRIRTTARAVTADPRFDRCVGGHRVDLPRRAVGILHPYFVLHRVAARRPLLLGGV